MHGTTCSVKDIYQVLKTYYGRKHDNIILRGFNITVSKVLKLRESLDSFISERKSVFPKEKLEKKFNLVISNQVWQES